MDPEDAEQLRALIQKRGTVKASVTRFATYLATAELNHDFTQVQLRHDKTKPAWEEFEDLQASIERLDVTPADDHAQEREAFENAYFAAMATASRITQICTLPTARASPREFLPDNSMQVKLPTINLPTFSGEFDQWMGFIDTFTSLIHDNPSISPIQRFHYLRSAVIGDAAEVIHSLEISAENYDIAWELLKERFHNERTIIQNHVKALFDLPVCTRESHSSLRQLLDQTSRHLRCLKSLGQPIEAWDTVLIHLITSKFDPSTKREWETVTDAKKLPDMDDLYKFLQQRCHLLQSLSNPTSTSPKVQLPSPATGWVRQRERSADPRRRERNSKAYITANKPACPKCKSAHLLYHCPEFLALSPSDRIKVVKGLHLCFNCLRSDHQVNQCASGSCRTCARRHHSMLHLNSVNIPPPEPVSAENRAAIQHGSGVQPASSSPENTSFHASLHTRRDPQEHTQAHTIEKSVILSTARVIVFDNNGNPQECRALLDCGSQSNFISQDLALKLGLPLHLNSIPVSGINQSVTQVSHHAETTIKSRLNGFQAHMSFLVLPTISEKLPSYRLDRRLLHIPNNVKLADPGFDKPALIDMLIGAEMFWNLLCVGQIKTSPSHPILQKTHLGWIISGGFSHSISSQASSPKSCFLVAKPDLHQQMQKFWDIEETPTQRHFSPEESDCEAHFVANTSRDINGHFVVRLPLRTDTGDLGDSHSTAMRRFHQLERKWYKYSSLKQGYLNDFNDYISKGHMEIVPESDLNTSQRSKYYLPHHAVIKEQSISTKLRVVFDGSAPSSNGTSLNDLLMVGPTIQDDLLSIILRFRRYPHVITADIVKMYRQIQVHPDDRDLQRILWRPNPDVPVGTYRLTTVTFGTASAPFLATRCLTQVAEDVKNSHPSISDVIQRHFYMDDLLSGANTVREITNRKLQISQVLAAYGFQLHKWNSTCADLRDENVFGSPDSTAMQLTSQKPIKTLGIFWNSTCDQFSYQLNPKETSKQCTKRSILAVIAGIFDPLGIIGPIIVRAKMLMQELWQFKAGWDEGVPQAVFTKWQTFKDDLPLLNQLRIPRRIISLSDPVEIHIHGFCDASESAYGACIYVCAVNKLGHFSSNLLCGRSRVAPLKTLSIPRLELCSAVLLAHTTNKVIKALDLKPKSTTLWSDSTVALAWIASSPHRWHTFVANRVSEIQTLTADASWLHISSQDNPADLLSRGCTSHQLCNETTLWWHGPNWLSKGPSEWQSRSTLPDFKGVTHEARAPLISLVAVNTRSEFFSKFASLSTLINVISHCLRFAHNCRNAGNKTSGPLSVGERNDTLLRLLQSAQHEIFPQEFRQLSRSLQVSSPSRLLSLAPFLDENHLIRVGGRLQRSALRKDQIHPIVLPPHHPLTVLIIKAEHIRHLHAGTLGTLAAVRQRYWLLSGRRTVQGIVRACMKCFRAHPPQHQNPTMGQLPTPRITPSRPFSTCGVDFAGPFFLRQGGARSKVKVKAYLAVFVCFSTRAVHLELVSALSSEAFLGTLKRFIGRRGKPSQIFSDNGTNFTGACNELRLMKKQFYKEECQHKVNTWLADKNIQWSFIPASSPHFGGIWEAAVKSAKRHLIPVMGNASLTFEELTTLLVQVESCLNSRPITPLSSDPNDLCALTPGHFLIGGPLTAIEEASLQDISINRLSRWQRIQQLSQHFWSRWSREYLSQLQQRTKWTKATPPIQVGTMVILKDDRIPPLKWPIGRVIQVHPGKDGIVRVVTVRTSSGNFKRTVSKVCVIPLEASPQ